MGDRGEENKRESEGGRERIREWEREECGDNMKRVIGVKRDQEGTMGEREGEFICVNRNTHEFLWIITNMFFSNMCTL